MARQNHIEGVDQVGRCIDQRSVEIEDDGRGGHGAAASAGRGRGKARGSGPAYLKDLPPQAVPAKGMRSNRELPPFMNAETYKREAAAGALDFVKSGMRLGLGTGSTARPFVELLGDRVRAGLDIIAVPTSEATRIQAEQCGIPLTTLDETPELDLTIDGADEIAPDLALIKGGGGALLREKIVASASARMVVIADDSKWVAMLGRFPLPIEVVPFGLAVDKTRRGGRDDRGGLSRPDLAAQGQGRPCFRHGRRPFHPRCGVAADRRSARAGGAAGGHSGSCRTRAFHRARPCGGDCRARRPAHRRAALNKKEGSIL